MISREYFFKEITINIYNRLDLIFFILNTLHHIKNSGYWYCYCTETSFLKKKWFQNAKCCLPSRCQLCVILEIFDGFVSFIDRNRFNSPELRKYYKKLKKELIKCFNDLPSSTKCFLKNEFVFGGRDWHSGKYWRVPLSESIRYDGGIF